ncbi:MAG: MerR family transcriptional regulator [Acidimicrobiales bacterium]
MSGDGMSIGELARQAAVSTRTLRFWADQGLIPCDRTASGYRSFGPEALAAAGLIRVLRELDVDLATIRSILEGRRDLAAVVTAHVGVIDARIAQLRFQRSVLRAVATTHQPDSEELLTMYDLANLTADQRRRIITELVDEVFAGVDDPGPVAERMRTAIPDLPDDPTPEQVAAWVALAQMVEDPALRARLRDMATGAVAASGDGPADEGQPGLATAVSEHGGAAVASGVDPASPEAARVVEAILTAAGPVVDRAALADRLERFTDARVDRYWALLAVINGWPAWPSQVPAFEWFIAALRASLGTVTPPGR